MSRLLYQLGYGPPTMLQVTLRETLQAVNALWLYLPLFSGVIDETAQHLAAAGMP